jgi:hypothetical protein
VARVHAQRSSQSDLRRRPVGRRRQLIDRFTSRAARSRLAPFARFAQTICKHRNGILAAMRLEINQGHTEALNNKVRLITRRAYGFHFADAALALVMLTCRRITLQPPHQLHAPRHRQPSPHRCRESQVPDHPGAKRDVHAQVRFEGVLITV